MTTREYHRARRASRASRGVCISCDNKPSVRRTGKLKGKRYLHCDDCRRIERARMRDTQGVKNLGVSGKKVGRPLIDDEDLRRRKKALA